MSIEDQTDQTSTEKRIDTANDIARSLMVRVDSMENLSDQEKKELLGGISEIKYILEKIRDSLL